MLYGLGLLGLAGRHHNAVDSQILLVAQGLHEEVLVVRVLAHEGL